MEVYDNSNQTVDLNQNELIIVVNDKDITTTNENDKYTNIVELSSNNENITFIDENGNDTSIAHIVEQTLPNGEKQKVVIVQIVNKNNTTHNVSDEIQLTIKEHKNSDGDDYSYDKVVREPENIEIVFGKHGIFVGKSQESTIDCEIKSGGSLDVDLAVYLKEKQDL